MSQSPRRGVAHHYSTEKLLAFRDVPAIDKLRWLEEMRIFLERFQPEEQRALSQKFRKGEI